MSIFFNFLHTNTGEKYKKKVSIYIYYFSFFCINYKNVLFNGL